MASVQRPKVLLLGDILHAHEKWSAISRIADVVCPTSTCRQDFLQEAKSGAFDGVTAIYRTNRWFYKTGQVDGELLDYMPKSLKFICQNGAGCDQIDISACSARSILVSNTPDAVEDATADMTIWLLLGALRNLPIFMHSLREGQWRGNPLPPLGHDPQGKSLGILGMGGIGRNVARKARAFGMSIKYHNRSRLSSELEDGAEYVSFEALLKGSDVLSLNLPLNDHTYHLISTEQFNLMKPGVVIVNTARGAIIDEAALVAALSSGKVASAGLDVFEDEPQVHPSLISNPKVLLVPHMGTLTVETGTKMEISAIENVYTALTTSKLRNVVPEQKIRL